MLLFLLIQHTGPDAVLLVVLCRQGTLPDPPILCPQARIPAPKSFVTWRNPNQGQRPLAVLTLALQSLTLFASISRDVQPFENRPRPGPYALVPTQRRFRQKAPVSDFDPTPEAPLQPETEVSENSETSEVLEVPEPYVYTPPPIPVPPVEVEPVIQLQFDIKNTEIPSFKFLQDARKEIYSHRRALESFARQVEGLGDTGDEGRRRGLGCWMMAEYEKACQFLGGHEADDVASFTHANALMSLKRPGDAAPIFKRLSEKYPGEHKPLGGYLLARLEAAACEPGEDATEIALAQLDQDLAAAGQNFAQSAEGQNLLGRAAEIRRDTQAAIDHYLAAREIAPEMRGNLFRLAYLAERAGLDDLALSCYQELLRMRPIDRTVLMNLGLLYEDMGMDQEAATCYDTVKRHDPTDSRARLYLGHALAGMSMYYDEDLERKEDRLNQILRIPITDFELSVRARNCLNKMNIMSLGDLVRKTEQELLSYKNFGETSLNEIKEILGSKGLRLGMAREEAVLSIEQSQRRYTTGQNVEAMNRPIADLELSIRARRTVEALGCLTVGDVVQHSEDELLGMPNFGVTSLVELREKLSEFSLSLKSSK